MDGAILDAARETELLIHDLRTYFHDVNAALRKVGSKASVRDVKINRHPRDERYDLSLQAVLTGHGKTRRYEFEFDIEDREVCASVKQDGEISVGASHYSYDRKDVLKLSLSTRICEALPTLDRIKLAADGANVPRPRLA